VISFPLLNLTLAVFLSPELGFFGFVMPTLIHTPFISGLNDNCGDVFFRARWATRQPRRTWLNVAGRGVEEVNVRWRVAVARGRRDGDGDEGLERIRELGNRTRRQRKLKGMAGSCIPK